MANSSSVQKSENKRHSSLFNFVKRLVKEKPLGMIGASITLLLLLIGIFANFIAPYGMNQPTADLLAPPSLKYWLGTDNLGRDLLSRIIFGARISVVVGLGSACISVALSTLLGILCGYIGGTFDLLVQRFVDAWMCIPSLILMMVLISIIGPGIWQVTVVMGLCFGITGSRITRSATMSIKEDVYLQAVRAIGCPPSRILINHILPNIMPSLIILFSTVVPMVILVEASLSFLGFGIPPPTPSWGSMLSGSARDYMFKAPWIAIWPGLFLSIVVYGVNMFGDALRDMFDPRLRGGIGRYGVKVKKDPLRKRL